MLPNLKFGLLFELFTKRQYPFVLFDWENIGSKLPEPPIQFTHADTDTFSPVRAGMLLTLIVLLIPLKLNAPEPLIEESIQVAPLRVPFLPLPEESTTVLELE